MTSAEISRHVDLLLVEAEREDCPAAQSQAIVHSMPHWEIAYQLAVMNEAAAAANPPKLKPTTWQCICGRTNPEHVVKCGQCGRPYRPYAYEQSTSPVFPAAMAAGRVQDYILRGHCPKCEKAVPISPVALTLIQMTRPGELTVGCSICGTHLVFALSPDPEPKPAEPQWNPEGPISHKEN